METVSGTRVLIVDDHPAFRASAQALLESEGCDGVTSVASGEEALDVLKTSSPDIVLLDLYLPRLDGVSVSEQIALMDEPPAVILISSHDEAGLEERVISAPVRGFLAKRELAWTSIARLLA